MCIGIAQYKLDYGKSFRETDLEKLPFTTDFRESMKNSHPNNLRLNLWKEGIIIKKENDFKIQKAQFAWLENKKSGGTWPVFNVRVEGGWNNKENDSNYNGPYKIYANPYVKDLMQFNRCLIPCDFFVEQPSDKKIKKKYIIKKPNEQPIYLAGVYKEMSDEYSGEVKTFFTILTTSGTDLSKRIGHYRSPVIINENQIETYLNKSTPAKELNTLFRPPENEDLIAYEVDPIIAKLNCPLEQNDPKLMEAIGPIISV